MPELRRILDLVHALGLRSEELRCLEQELKATDDERLAERERARQLEARLAQVTGERDLLACDLENLLGCTGVAAFFLDQELRVQRFTAASQPLTRLLAADLGRSLADLRWRFEDPSLLEHATQTLVDARAREAEVEVCGRKYRRQVAPYRALDGAVRGVAITLVDVDAERRALGVAERAREELARRVAERDAIQERARRLEELGQTAGAMAHEFKNLLLGLHGAAVLARDSLGDDGAAAREPVARLVDAAERGLRLTRRLLGLVPSEPTPLGAEGLDDVVRDLEPLLRSLVRGRVDAETRLTLTLEAPVVVRAGASDLERALLNLVLNACDACREGGGITLSTRAPGLAAPPGPGAPEREYAVVTVRDTGCGMDPDTLRRAGEPGFTTKGGEGSGLGLTSVQTMAERAGGFLRLESAPGLGTEASLFLPVLEAPVARPSAASPGTPEGEATCEGVVLLVEDDPLVRLSLQHTLARAGYEVLAAESLREALGLWRHAAARIGLVLSDLWLGDGSGAELRAELQGAEPAPSFLFMTALPPALAELELGAPGAVLEEAVLEKPFSSSELLQRLRSLRPRAG